MSNEIERSILEVLGLSEVDKENILDSDGYIDLQTRQYIQTDRTLRQIIRSMIEYFVALEKPQVQTAQKQ